jgi:hypothetical protein
MVIHRRQLPIVGRCEGFVPAPGSTATGGFCERCQQEVHDVSAMRESELRRFLAARVGTEVCVSYRTDAEGRLRLRPEPAPVLRQPLAVGALALLLAACAGHATELEAPGPVCRDADGYVVACDEPPAPEMLSLPEAVAAREPAGEGCPVRPTTPQAGGPRSAHGTSIDPAHAWPNVPPLRELTKPPTGEPTPAAQPTAATARVDLVVDPENVFGRIIIGRWIDRDFVPTAELVAQARARRAERKQARERWRAGRRATASR